MHRAISHDLFLEFLPPHRRYNAKDFKTTSGPAIDKKYTVDALSGGIVLAVSQWIQCSKENNYVCCGYKDAACSEYKGAA